MRIKRFILDAALLLSCFSAALGQTAIPGAAWRIPIGSPVGNPGGHRPELGSSNIDDGYWQGAPVGGIGAGTFSRSYRGFFERWHMKAGNHKYENVPANQFAVFAQQDGGSPVSMALAVGKPVSGALGSWNWNYPAGDGEYAALYPRSWFAYGTKSLPVRLTVEQFSPILPDNYKETSYPVAVYRWNAENPSAKPVTVSILFSWTNMVGWFRDELRNFDGALNQQNFNSYVTEQTGAGQASGIVFDRKRQGPVEEQREAQDSEDGRLSKTASRPPRRRRTRERMCPGRSPRHLRPAAWQWRTVHPIALQPDPGACDRRRYRWPAPRRSAL